MLALRGSYADAERYAALAESLSDEDDIEAQIAWRTARAKVLANTGRPRRPSRLPSRRSPSPVEGEDVQLKADALTELGRVLAMVGHRESSGPPLREALRLVRSER